MHRRTFVLSLLLMVALSLPVMASQFIEVPFDQLARQSTYIVRGTLGPVHSQWDASGEVIYSYATVRVTRYYGDFAGPDTLLVREVGGTVDGYRQEAIGFPTLREGQDVVLFLTRWENSTDFRIDAYNQGKLIVQKIRGVEMVMQDPVQQGQERLSGEQKGPFIAGTDAAAGALALTELEEMVTAALQGRERGTRNNQ